MRRHLLLLAVAFFTGCGGPADGPDGGTSDGGDPCAPHGHIHRDPEGDWCHCDRGFVASEEGLACVPDPAFVPRDGGFDFGDDGAHACFHVTHGPYATVTSTEQTRPRVDAFHTLYTANLRPADGGHVGTFSYRAFATGAHVVYLSDVATVRFIEEGVGEVPLEGTKATTACEGLRHMAGFELVEDVTYRFEVGPITPPTLRFVIEHLP